MKSMLAVALVLASFGAALASDFPGPGLSSRLAETAKLPAPAAAPAPARAPASQPGPESSWDEIRSVYKAFFPMVGFGSTFMSLDGVCVEGDQLRTLSPVEECVRWQSWGRQRSCVEKRSVHLRTPIVYEDRECVRRDSYPRRSNQCVEYRSVIRRHELSPMVGVGRRQVRRGESPFSELFQKRYEVPACP